MTNSSAGSGRVSRAFEALDDGVVEFLPLFLRRPFLQRRQIFADGGEAAGFEAGGVEGSGVGADDHAIRVPAQAFRRHAQRVFVRLTQVTESRLDETGGGVGGGVVEGDGGVFAPRHRGK